MPLPLGFSFVTIILLSAVLLVFVDIQGFVFEAEVLAPECVVVDAAGGVLAAVGFGTGVMRFRVAFHVFPPRPS